MCKQILHNLQHFYTDQAKVRFEIPGISKSKPKINFQASLSTPQKILFCHNIVFPQSLISFVGLFYIYIFGTFVKEKFCIYLTPSS